MTKQANQYKRISKFLSLILRHKPETIDLKLDENGWASVEELLEKVNRDHFVLLLDDLKAVVEQNDKKRFSFSPDFSQIRVNQGHSIRVDLKLEQQSPPDLLFHGTATRNLDSIKEKGLLKGQRNHVHLSADQATARNVGIRYGKPMVLHIDTGKMHHDGHSFYLSDNGVWLVDHVPSDYIKFPDLEG